MSFPTASQRAFFDTHGYLLLPGFLEADLVERLLEVVHAVAARRRALEEAGETRLGMTHLRGPDTRIFYLLEDDPLLLDMVDHPAIWPYVTGLLNPKPHFHA